jgi:NAD(P)-dependent dehydrogenase (short-subunit alcohol dehydrogenase family)
MLLANKIAVLTGNTYGIGRETAALFAREGASVICIDDTHEGWTADGSAHGRPDFVADVTNAAAVAAVIAQCRTVGRVDILFNLAGRALKQRFETTTEETWREMLARNLSAAFICSQQFLPLLKESPGAAIINHASIDAFLGNPSIAAYSAAKGGVLPLTHVMAHDLAKYGIRVNSISTGAIRDGGPRPGDEARVKVTPLGRTGTPRDVANVALFLASELSSDVNGANIVVDGGRTTITQGCYDDDSA